MVRRILWALICAGALVGATFAAVSAASNRATKSPIIIGGVDPLSEPGNVAGGIDSKWAMNLAVSDINRAGGVLGRPLKLIFQDTQGTPNVGESVAHYLVEQKHVVGVVGEFHSAVALAAIPVYSKAHVPMVWSETWNDAITAGDPAAPNLPARPKYVFRIAPTVSLADVVYSDWILNGIKARRVVHIYEATDNGLSFKKSIEAHMATKPGTHVTEAEVQLNQADYSPTLSRIAAEDPNADLVIVNVTGQSGYTVVQNAIDVGLINDHTKCLTDLAAADAKSFWHSAPDGVGCAFEALGPLPSKYNKMTRSVVSRYNQKFHQSPGSWVFEAYDSTRLLADAIRRAGGTNPNRIVNALESTHFVGAQGLYVFPYGSKKPVPAGKPGWLWHQWPTPTVSILEYTQRNQPLTKAVPLWPKSVQTRNSAYISVKR